MDSKILRTLAVVAALGMAACVEDKSTPAADFDATVARQWMQLLHDRVRDDRRPPVHAARIYAYGAIALYESAVEGMPDFRSLSGQLNAMPAVPTTGTGEYDWPSAANAAASTVAEVLLPSDNSRVAIDAVHEEQHTARETAGIAAEVIERSDEYGHALGEAILAWAATDGFAGTRGRTYVVPVGPDKWVPTPPAFAASPLEPYWGELRTFALAQSDSCAPAAPAAFSSIAGSAFHAQAAEVYQTSITLTAEQRTVALFWADNPGETGTPPGHWVAIMNQLTASREMNLEEAVEMYVRVGIALHDAFVSCWQAKYSYNLLRPVSYIQRYINPIWTPLVATPAFPEYTSGHSTQSGAAAAVLTDLFGTVAFTDRTHDTRGFAPRQFASFETAAREAAVSRLYGGIHYPMGNNNGITQGQCVGQALVDRVATRR